MKFLHPTPTISGLKWLVGDQFRSFPSVSNGLSQMLASQSRQSSQYTTACVRNDSWMHKHKHLTVEICAKLQV